MERRFNNNASLTKLLKDPPGIYRWSVVGQALRESLTELGNQGKINPFIEHHTLKVFDQQMTESMSDIVKQDDVKFKEPLQFHGKGQDKHSFIDGSWEMHIENVILGPNSMKSVVVEKVRIMADNWSDKSVEQRKIIQSLIGNKRGRKRKR